MFSLIVRRILTGHAPARWTFLLDVAVLTVISLHNVAGHAVQISSPGRQWRALEISLVAARDYPDPFDYRRIAFTAVFQGPAGQRLEIPGFWDGGRTWKIRFTPTLPGEWSYKTACSDASDAGLHGQRGRFNVLPAAGDNPLYRHGGFLNVSYNGRYLTYTDGTPFFWLGDTWWACPSANVPFDAFRQMVDHRVRQGYTVFQAHGHRPIFPQFQPDHPAQYAPEEGVGAFAAVRQASPEALRYWHETDKYIAYANDRGLVGVMGFAGHTLLDPISLDDLERLWHYYLARYGAYAITFLITQEYNAELGQVDARVPKILALGRFLQEFDPYLRAMTVHPWVHSRDKRQAWGEPWYGFILLQAGHRQFAKPEFYLNIHRRGPIKPMIEGEANYEGFHSDRFEDNAAAVRRSAYTAFQSGCCGFTYGAQGLYAGVLDKKCPGPTARWGPMLTWQEGLALPGGEQMKHLRACYESVDWWKLEPRPAAVEPKSDVLVSAVNKESFLIYFLGGGKVPEGARLVECPRGTSYSAEWFDPRSGRQAPLADRLTGDQDGLVLPRRLDDQEWMLVLRRYSDRSGASD